MATNDSTEMETVHSESETTVTMTTDAPKDDSTKTENEEL